MTAADLCFWLSGLFFGIPVGMLVMVGIRRLAAYVAKPRSAR